MRASVYAVLCLAGLIGFAAPNMAICAVSEHQTAPASGTHTTRLSLLYDRLKAAGEAAEKGNLASAKSELLVIIAEPEFAKFTAQGRWAAYFLLAAIENSQGNNEAAYKYLKLAGETGDAKNHFMHWALLDDVASKLKIDDAKVEALTMMVRIDPAQVNGFNAKYVFAVVRKARSLDDKGVRLKALLEALWQANYTPAQPFFSGAVESLRFNLFTIYVDEGQTDKAMAILPSLTDSQSILKLRVDNRYRSYVQVVKLDFAAALKASLDKTRQEVKALPRAMRGRHELASALLEQNQLSEALSVLDEAVAAADAAPKDKPVFDDQDEYLNWMQDTRARILVKLGRWDEVLAAQLKARDIAMRIKEDTVSQTINLGDLYVEVGRPKDALEAVKSVSDKGASLYGLMSAEEVRVCAYAQLNDMARMEKSLKFMRANAKEAPSPFESALLCANDMDGLAKLIISRLEDVKMRSSALVSVQTYLMDANPTDHGRMIEARRAAVLLRPDVKAAIDRYGVIESFPIFAPFD